MSSSSSTQEEPRIDQQDESWTDEKHLRFLNFVEARFVRTMLEDNGRLLRLDRYLPDSSESTLDSKLHTHRRKKHATSVEFRGIRTRTTTNGRIDKRTRRRSSSQPYDHSALDQVVPQIEGGKDDQREHANVPDAPSN